MSGGMPPDTLAGDLGGGLPAQFRVGPDRVVIVPPGGQHEPGMSQRGEQGLVEAFVPQAAIEALHEAILHWFSRRDVMPFDPAIEDGESVSAIKAIRSKYDAAGYKTPDVIFWNIQSRRGNNIPVRFDERGTALISGFSPSIMKSLLNGKSISPMDIMYETINSPRYESIKA